MQLGISSWSLPWSVGVPGYPLPQRPLDAMGLLDKAVEAGVAVVQIADNLPLHELPEAELDRLRDASAAHGVALEVGTRSLDPTHLLRYVAIAQRIGARALRTVLSGTSGGLGDLKAAEDRIRQLVDELNRRNVLLALENNEVFAAEEYAAIVRRVAAPTVGICVDTANSLGRPEPLSIVLDHLAEHTIMVHAKDYEIRRIESRMGFSVVGMPAGRGRVDFDLVLRRLRELGHDEVSVIIEHWPPFQRDIEVTIRCEQEWLEQSLRFLRPKVTA